jgi:conserved oligomeric Golgi complex subunit 8
MTTGLTSTLSMFSNTLDTLLDDIPVLESSASTFSSEITSIQSFHCCAALVLEHSSKLQDILEQSMLADACVCGGNFQEVFDLTAHATRLAVHFLHMHAKVNGTICTLFGLTSRHP